MEVHARGLWAVAALLLVPYAAVASEPELSEAERIVYAAKAQAREIPLQAEAMVRLAWLDPTAPHEVRELARRHLVDFGARSMHAIRRAVTKVDPLYCADVAAAAIEAKEGSQGLPADYLATLETVLWYGSVDAKRIAILIVASNRYVPAMPIAIEAMYTHPELTETVLRALPMFGNSGARHTLGHFLNQGTASERRIAARSLTQMGSLASEVLREALLSDDPLTRSVAVEVFLPKTAIDDLTTLYEYLAQHPEDDPATLEAIRERAQLLESVLVQYQDAQAASASEE